MVPLCLLLGWLAAAAPASLNAQRVLFVNAQASGANSGARWSDAFMDLQNALSAAFPGDEIWVAAGRYYPGPSGNRTASFQLKTGVALYGGFSGGETNREQRDPIHNQSNLCGDLARNDLPGWVNYADNAYHVVNGSNTEPTALLDGFVIEGGNASALTGANSSGGGLRLERGHPTIANCRFRLNLARAGAGMMAVSSSPVLSNCLFAHNLAQSQFASGGAIYMASGSAPVFAQVHFHTNMATGGSASGGSGAVHIAAGCPATFTGCTFAGNKSVTSGANMATGGAVTSLASGVSFGGCSFRENMSGNGGAVWNGGSSARFRDCSFSGNTAAAGGALLNFGSQVALVGCTFAGNSATEGGALHNGFSSQVGITNSILWGNVASNAIAVFERQVKNIDGATVAVDYSCVEGLFEPPPGQPPPTTNDFPGSIDADPLLADAPHGRLNLTLGSPCIDAGKNAAVPAGTSFDVEGHPRFVNEPLVTDAGPGVPPIVDMGSHEYQGVFAEQIGPLSISRGSMASTNFVICTYLLDKKLTNATVAVESSPTLAPAQWSPALVMMTTNAEINAALSIHAESLSSPEAQKFFRLKVTVP